jgi:hypothetical protein
VLLGKDPQRFIDLDTVPVALEPLTHPMQHLEIVRPQLPHAITKSVHES